MSAGLVLLPPPCAHPQPSFPLPWVRAAVGRGLLASSSVLFLWAFGRPPQEQGADWVTAASVWEAQVSGWCPSKGQRMVQGDSQTVH